MSRLSFNGKALKTNNGVISMPPIYKDWYLPVQSDYTPMHQNLQDYGIGNFLPLFYWSSWEGTSETAAVFTMEFGNGTSKLKTTILPARPVRTFQAPIGSYNLRDIGPAGGWIYSILNTTYYEAYWEDIPAGPWSNITNVLVGGTNNPQILGMANTLLIINQPGHEYSMAQACRNIVTHGSL